MKLLITFVGLIFIIACIPPAAPQLVTTCSYKCQNAWYFPILATWFPWFFRSSEPQPNPNHVKTANGCGSKGLYIDDDDLPKEEIEDCCNAHDICYDTCNSVKLDCDEEFKTCMFNTCGNVTDLKSLECMATADTFYGIVRVLGCSSYLDAQINACICR